MTPVPIIGEVHRIRTRTNAGRIRHRCPHCRSFVGRGAVVMCRKCRLTFVEVTDGVYEVSRSG